MTRKRFPSAPNFWHANALLSLRPPHAAAPTLTPPSSGHQELARKLLARAPDAVEHWKKTLFGFAKHST